MTTDIDDYTSKTPDDPKALYDKMDLLSKGQSVAVISFLDYNPPDGLVGAIGEDPATKGAKSLDTLVDSLRSDGYSADQLSVVAHSYGSTTTGIAMEHYGLDVGRVAVVGSPGLGDGVDDISDLGRPDIELYAGKSEGVPIYKVGDGDNVTWLPAHGEDPADDGFGATVFETSGEGHSEYFTGKGLENLALIALGETPSAPK
jgi:pimeloyl-ACP methyl ester carboxylesterase